MTYYTDKQNEQVQAFITKFMDEIDWLRSPAGVDTFADKSTMDDGSISEAEMLSYLFQYILDAAQDIGMQPRDIRNLIASGTLRWSRTNLYDIDERNELRPIFAHYLDN
jgi:hypothetical protein